MELQVSFPASTFLPSEPLRSQSMLPYHAQASQPLRCRPAVLATRALPGISSATRLGAVARPYSLQLHSSRISVCCRSSKGDGRSQSDDEGQVDQRLFPARSEDGNDNVDGNGDNPRVLPAVPGITTQVEKMSVASQRLQDYFDRTRARLMFGEGEGETGMSGLEGRQGGGDALKDAQLAEWRKWGDVFFEVQHREVLLNTLQVRGEDDGVWRGHRVLSFCRQAGCRVKPQLCDDRQPRELQPSTSSHSCFS